MTDWLHMVHLGPPFDARSGQDFTEYRDRVVKILDESAWIRQSPNSWTLADYVHDMTIVDDVDWFDTVLDGIRNLAEEDRCLITWSQA